MSNRTDFAFMVDGVDRREEWDRFAHEIWSELCSCALWDHWRNFDPKIHEYARYRDVDPWDLEFMSCAYCGTYGVRMNLEHVLPRKYYPELAFDRDNIVIACESCNKEKCNKVGPSVGKMILPFQQKLVEKKNKELSYRRY